MDGRAEGDRVAGADRGRARRVAAGTALGRLASLPRGVEARRMNVAFPVLASVSVVGLAIGLVLVWLCRELDKAVEHMNNWDTGDVS